MRTTEVQATPPIPSEILIAALALNESQRAALGNQLLLSLEGDQITPFSGWPDNWEEELERRAGEVESGHVTTFSTEEVLSRIRETLDSARRSRANNDVIA